MDYILFDIEISENKNRAPSNLCPKSNNMKIVNVHKKYIEFEINKQLIITHYFVFYQCNNGSACLMVFYYYFYRPTLWLRFVVTSPS